MQLLEDALKWAYEQIENTFLKINKQQIESKMKYVGTCGITAVFYKDNVILGNAGDSQAIFITQKGTDDKFEYFTANERLTANNKN